MRIAVVSDIHSNMAAFEAVLADLRETSPDLVFHGGDLAHGGSSPAEVVDAIRDLSWPGVLGNTEELLFLPEAFEEFARPLPQLDAIWKATREMAVFSREALGPSRIAWLASLPRVQQHEALALVHASPESTWRSPAHDVPDADWELIYGSLGKPVVVFGHIHRPFIRAVNGFTVINTGSVSLSYDGDPRASYLLLDDGMPTIRRVAYDVEQEIKQLAVRRMPYAEWISAMLRSGSAQTP